MKSLIASTALSLAFAGAAAAQEEHADHYEPEPSETFTDAVENFNTYNARVAEILEKEELSFEDMEQIHQYTYTIETALAKINDTLEDLPATLERVHLASEGDNPDELRGLADVYLETAMELQ
jgi:hypothetical protein